jgi:hypothetical protein
METCPVIYTEQRLLNRTEKLLADYLDDERQAVALAPHVYIPEGLTQEAQDHRIEEVIISVLAEALDHGDCCEYVSGQRRDTLRG